MENVSCSSLLLTAPIRSNLVFSCSRPGRDRMTLWRWGNPKIPYGSLEEPYNKNGRRQLFCTASGNLTKYLTTHLDLTKPWMNQLYHFPIVVLHGRPFSWFSRHQLVIRSRLTGGCRVTLSWITSIWDRRTSMSLPSSTCASAIATLTADCAAGPTMLSMISTGNWYLTGWWWFFMFKKKIIKNKRRWFQLKGRGSINRATGPSRDHSTFGSGNPSRGYVFIDSGYPRRPGDKAKLVSPQMQPTGL